MPAEPEEFGVAVRPGRLDRGRTETTLPAAHEIFNDPFMRSVCERYLGLEEGRRRRVARGSSYSGLWP
ncbi:hypothetical protein ODJ79_38800 [Actinoplanes sp. KI2]|uniref:hypothetical protein n=1 Tax=Actinoplanes sp. KI2 TaxID=2983315 RepID=UPI0021D59C11|nr:hypothetical protein [Actinoplanes sp. KI2]MCU7729702.1 hypothetical protein [Actinoplanes sp. KI2]